MNVWHCVALRRWFAVGHLQIMIDICNYNIFETGINMVHLPSSWMTQWKFYEVTTRSKYSVEGNCCGTYKMETWTWLDCVVHKKQYTTFTQTHTFWLFVVQ